MNDTEPDLEESVAELADVLGDLRDELQKPPTGPFGIPRPPRPGELLTVTERYTIPALISLFETSIRLLELLAATIRLVEGRPLDGTHEDIGNRTAAEGRKQLDRLAGASRTTLGKLDDALSDLQSAAEDSPPDNPEVQRLLEEARELRAEVDNHLAATIDEEPSDDVVEPIGIAVREDSRNDSDENEDETPGDIEAELESLKEDAGVDPNDETVDDTPPEDSSKTQNGK